MPPPPPPAPPPLPKQPIGASNNKGKSSNCEPPADRNALLSQIRKGARLKKSETNDRSAPLVDGNRPPPSNTSAKRNTDGPKANGPFPIIPPGGLFAQGIPKLRPTTPRTENNSNPPLAMVIQSIKQNNTSSLRVNQLSGSRSQPPSPVSKPKATAVSLNRTVNSESSEISSLGGNPNFPDDINIKGPAPAPPPQSQKPVFKSTTNAESDSTARHPTVKRSASQTNLQRPRLTRPPPSEKPPPPPKSNPAPPSSAPPPPPSKPPNIMRRQSFGVGESHISRFASNKLSVANAVPNATPKSNPKVIGPPPPPPPPRNNSAPNDLNQMVMSSSPGNHCVKMNIAPPPPPNRAVTTGMRAAPVRPPPPRAPAPPPPPPPPQHQLPVHPAPPSQMKAVPASHMAPPPPARVSSMKQSASDSFEERFKSQFCSAQSLPKPEKFTNFQKSYPSKMARQKQNTRRQPPPPPPQAGANLGDRSRSNPVIAVQYDSGIFSGSYDHS